MRISVDSVYYNIFKFQCFVRAAILYLTYPFFGSPVVNEVTVTRNGHGPFREYLFTQIKEGKGTLAGRIVMGSLMLSLLTPWNLLCGVLQIHSTSVYWSGWVALGIMALVVSVKADNPKKHLKDFQIFSMCLSVRKAAVLSLVIAVGICSIFIISFAFYLRSLNV